ncbi:OmpA family protein [Thermosipho ferrireducens]|uniref:OmpA family protein n=1 Tax=Thermosipho ferrireducens TaxID=2571116 RepID=A0ABX7SAH8_9BACT|nr:flagellar motor protein MotB [Thermosipho ferrireducens]QTA38762.1 OmpA family protein [Thermosipho ferrireducens]
MANKKCECPKGAPAWMTTYGDMVTLLLTFFVLLFAFSSISPGKFQQVAVGLASALSGSPPSVLMGGRSLQEEPLISQRPGVYEEILRISEEYKGKVTIEERDEGTLIIISNLDIFESGSARLTAEAKKLLEKLGAVIIEHTNNTLEIFGYANELPLPESSIYQSNWHLSSARAASVVLFFTTELKQKRSLERIADIQLGRFDPDYYYNPGRFIPIGKGDVEIQKEIKALRAEYEYKLENMRKDLVAGKITREQWNTLVAKLTTETDNKIVNLRKKYRRIDILIKREKAM